MTGVLLPGSAGELGVEDGRRQGGSGALRYLSAKVGGTLVSLLLVAVLGFFLFRILPGDPVATMTRGAPVGPTQIADLRHRLGLDQSVGVQFLRYLGGLLHGDLGNSYLYSRPVTALIGERLGPTVLLAGTATVLAAILGLWLGMRAGWRQGSAVDHVTTGIALTFWSVPTFWLGLLVLMVFAAGVGPIPGLFPTRGMTSPEVTGFVPQVLDVLRHLVLPCLTMVAVIYAQYVLVMRSSVVEEKGADYLVTARAKGLRDELVLRRHAAPNALLPTVTLLFLNLGLVVSGAITVETVFSWPGLGLLTYEAIAGPDLPLLQGLFLVFSGAVVLLNLAADLVYRLLDPRVRAA